MFTFEKDVPAADIGGGSVRQILAHGDELMVCKLQGAAGSGVAEHSHAHTQITYVISGRVQVTVSGETQTLCAGDSVFIPSNSLHSALNLDETVSLDIFSPCRRDFLGL